MLYTMWAKNGSCILKKKKKKKSEYCSQIGLKFNWDVLQYKVK